jgi:hypothetical protein
MSFDGIPPSLDALSKAIDRRVDRAIRNEDDLLNFDARVVAAREKLRHARSDASSTRILDVVAADGIVREALRAIIAERVVEVSE